jgi:hypothetical protein
MADPLIFTSPTGTDLSAAPAEAHRPAARAPERTHRVDLALPEGGPVRIDVQVAAAGADGFLYPADASALTLSLYALEGTGPFSAVGTGAVVLPGVTVDAPGEGRFTIGLPEGAVERAAALRHGRYAVLAERVVAEEDGGEQAWVALRGHLLTFPSPPRALAHRLRIVLPLAGLSALAGADALRDAAGRPVLASTGAFILLAI